MTHQYLNAGPAPEIAVPDCDDDARAYLFLAIVFVLTAVLIAGAAFIPHMWVLNCIVLLTLIVLLVLHDVRCDRNLRL